MLGEHGAGDEARTRDLLLGKQTLYQLSYSRVGGEDSAWGAWEATLRV